MSNFSKSILNSKLTLGLGVFPEGQKIKGVNNVFNPRVYIFNDGSVKLTIEGSFYVPENYVSGSKFIPIWDTLATSGDVEWILEYTVAAVGATLDPASVLETLNQEGPANVSSLIRIDTNITATPGNFSAGDKVLFKFSRDLTDVGDTISSAVRLHDLRFGWTN